MPINNSFLSDYTIGKVNYPQFQNNEIVLSDFSDVIYNNFSVNVNTDSSLQRLINYYHLPAVYLNGGLIFNYNISFPIIMLMSNDETELVIRENELKFWASWIQYAIAGMDKIVIRQSDNSWYTINAIVDKASISVSYDSVTLDLSIISNANLGWDVENKWISNNADKILMSRRAKGYDVYVKYTSYLDMALYTQNKQQENGGEENGSIIDPDKGWNYMYGIISAAINFSTNSGRIYTTQNNLSSNYITTDIMYTSTVDLNGYIEVFGKPIMSSFPVTVQYTEVLNWASLSDDVINSNMYNGGLQIWIGYFTTNNEEEGEEEKEIFKGRILSILPNNTFVYSAARTSSRTINERRNLYYISTQKPFLPDELDFDEYQIDR